MTRRNGAVSGVTTLEDNRGRGGLRNAQGTVGRGVRENEKFPHLCPVPSDQNPVVSVAVSIVSTGGLVSIGYGAISMYLHVEATKTTLMRVLFTGVDYKYSGSSVSVLFLALLGQIPTRDKKNP